MISDAPFAGWRRAIPGLVDRVPQIALPTLGGRHFWMDVAVTPTHRIQRQVWTGHFRLLDHRDRRLACGSLARCRAAARAHAANQVIAGPQPAGGTLVVLLHGLYRSRHSMAGLERRLNDAGLSTIAPNYPSGHAGLAELGRWLNRVVAGVEGYDRVVFVAYSLGGLVVRSALAADPAWRKRLPVAGIVQLGTPNRGAQLAGVLRGLPPGNRLSGPAARELCKAVTLPEPPGDIPVLVLAGGTAGRRGFNPWLDGDNDGIVRVAETRLDRPHDFRLLPTVHGLLVGHRDTAPLVLDAVALTAGEAFPGRPFAAPLRAHGMVPCHPLSRGVRDRSTGRPDTAAAGDQISH